MLGEILLVMWFVFSKASYKALQTVGAAVAARCKTDPTAQICYHQMEEQPGPNKFLVKRVHPESFHLYVLLLAGLCLLLLFWSGFTIMLNLVCLARLPPNASVLPSGAMQCLLFEFGLCKTRDE